MERSEPSRKKAKLEHSDDTSIDNDDNDPAIHSLLKNESPSDEVEHSESLLIDSGTQNVCVTQSECDYLYSLL